MPTGRADCNSTSAPMVRLVAPSAIRTPISLVRCSTRYESTLNSPDMGQEKRERSECQRHPERNCQKIRCRARHDLQRRDVAHVGIDSRHPLDQFMAGPLRAAAHTDRQRRSGRISTDRNVDACSPQIRCPQTEFPVPKSRATPTTTAVRARTCGSSGFGLVPSAPLKGKSIWFEPQDQSDGVAARPQLARDALGHDHHRGARAALSRREAASTDEVDVEDAKVPREKRTGR